MANKAQEFLLKIRTNCHVIGRRGSTIENPKSEFIFTDETTGKKYRSVGCYTVEIGIDKTMPALLIYMASGFWLKMEQLMEHFPGEKVIYFFVVELIEGGGKSC